MECPECDARLNASGGCPRCGWQPTPEEKPRAGIYRQFPDRMWQRSRKADLCPACGKMVGEHIEEFRHHVSVMADRMAGRNVPDEWRSRPSLLERMSVHKPRNNAVARRLEQERAG